MGASDQLARAGKQGCIEDKCVALVQLALATLRNQEIAHHRDPVPVLYLSSLQLSFRMNTWWRPEGRNGAAWRCCTTWL